MLKVGLQLTTWLPDVVVTVWTGAKVKRLVRVFSVTPANPLTIVGIPAEYPMLLAVTESNPVLRFVDIADAIQLLTRGSRRVSVTVTESSCTVTTVIVSGESKLPKFPDVGTLIDKPPV